MKNSLVVLTVVLASACATSVFAAPRALSSTELDAVAAGSGLADTFITAFTNPLSNQVAAAQTDTALNQVSADGGGIAVLGTGSTQVAAGAVATDNGTALNGDHNRVLATSGNTALGYSAAGDGNQVVDQSHADIAQTASGQATLTAIKLSDTSVEKGSALVIGDNNNTQITTDNTQVSGKIEDSVGVIAREATITNSFNSKTTNLDVKVSIDDSFNSTTNTQDISGQSNLSAIVNANTLGNAAIGANLNITTANASMPSMGVNGSAGTSTAVGNASATTNQHQVVLNYVAVNNGCISF